jgi:hypothetical protein
LKASLGVRALTFLTAFVMLVTLAGPLLGGVASADTGDARYFAATGFRIDNDTFWDYFQKRGGVANFGYPVSRTFTFLGKPTQFFQRRIVQINPDGGVGQLNLLDPGIMPYTSFNFATVPAADPNFTKSAPKVGSPNYGPAILTWIRQRAPNSVNGQPVNLFNTFNTTVSLATAFPKGGGNAGLLEGINLEMWGVPTSNPAADPHNRNFIYQRWQRGIMHYDATCKCTQGMLLADYFKGIITGSNLPGDVAAEAANSPFFKQYNPNASNWVNNPNRLPNTNLTNAFTSEAPTTPPPQTPTPKPTTTAFHYGFQVQFGAPGGGPGTDPTAVTNLVKGAGFSWVKQQIQWSTIQPTSAGSYNWGNLDAAVNTANAAGLHVLFSVVQAPPWAAVPNGAFPKSPSQFAAFMTAMATHFKGRVAAYEIWNEENFAREVGPGNINAGNYVELLKAAYPAIKAADPNAIVLSGAPTPTGVNDPNIAERDLTYLQQMYAYQGGVVKKYFDVLGAHNEPYANPPDQTVANHTRPTYSGDPSFFFRQVEDYRNLMVSQGDGSKQIWETEIGYDANPEAPSAYVGWTVTDQQQASYLVQLFQYARAHYNPWLGAIFVWNLNFQAVVPQTDEKWGFGVVGYPPPNYTAAPRPAYSGLQSMPKT